METGASSQPSTLNMPNSWDAQSNYSEQQDGSQERPSTMERSVSVSPQPLLTTTTTRLPISDRMETVSQSRHKICEPAYTQDPTQDDSPPRIPLSRMASADLWDCKNMGNMCIDKPRDASSFCIVKMQQVVVCSGPDIMVFNTNFVDK